jgi:tetratricopeptide (TPR) repeat protein
VGVPAVFFLLLELGLRAFGFGYPTSFFIRTQIPSRADEVYKENVDFGRRFFPPGLLRLGVPIVLPAVKSKDTYRVFVIGESAAMGFPDPAHGFSRILEVMLHQRYPTTQFEVINTAVVAINSHVALPIARECVEHAPDLFVVHLGNNEVVGPFGVAGVLGTHAPNLGMVRANLAIKSTRTGQLFDRLMQRLRPSISPSAWEGMATFGKSHVRADDPRLAGMLDNFQRNLEDVCRVGTAAGVPVLVCTIPVNLRDSAPFASEHAADLKPAELAEWEQSYAAGIAAEKGGRSGEELEHYRKAADIDATFADLVFRQARCLERQANTEAARQAYERARDLDALRFRSDTRINVAIRAVLDRQAPSGVHGVDAERDFAAASPGGVPGEDLFLEHVHMNFKGNYLLARSVFRAITQLPSPPGPPGTAAGPAELTEVECAKRLAYGMWGAYYAESEVRGMFRGEPFLGQLDHAERDRRWDARIQERDNELNKGGVTEAIAAYQRALEAAPNDWMLRESFADLLAASGDVPGSVVQFEIVVEQVPHHYSALRKLANLYLNSGQLARARDRLEAALRAYPGLMPARYDLARVSNQEGNYDAAVAAFQAAVDQDPNRAEGLTHFAGFYLTLGHRAEARARAEAALAINPDTGGAHIIMGQLLLEEGNLEGALQHFQIAVRTNPRMEPVAAKHIAEIEALKRRQAGGK